MFNSNDFLPEHRKLVAQLKSHFKLAGLIAQTNFEEGNLESASRCLDHQQDDLHKLIQLKSLKEKHDYQEKQRQLHEWLRQQQISFSVVRRNQK